MSNSVPDPRALPSSLLIHMAMAGLVALPALAAAQQGPPFEPPGPPPGINPPVGHDRTGVPPAHSHGWQAQNPAANPTTSNAITAARLDVEASLAEGSLTTPRGEAIQPGAQHHLLGVLRGVPAADLESFAKTLAPDGDEATRTAVRALSERLAELGRAPSSLGAAVESYNRFIDVSPRAFLRDPPAELLALQAALGAMVDAAYSAADQEAPDR